METSLIKGWQDVNNFCNFSPFSLIRERLLDCSLERKDINETARDIYFSLFYFMKSNNQIMKAELNSCGFKTTQDLVFTQA